MRRLVTHVFAVLLLAAPVAVAAPGPSPPPAAGLAMDLFGARSTPAAMPTASYGSYANGCLAGAVPMPETGPGWQVMRLSRNRNWGHPSLVAFLERLGGDARAIGWPGIYVGDMSQPRGGPMRSGHRSHQIGLDADIWLRRPDRHALSADERESLGSIFVVSDDRRSVNGNWTEAHHALLEGRGRGPGGGADLRQRRDQARALQHRAARATAGLAGEDPALVGP